MKNRLLSGACAVLCALFAAGPAYAGDFKGFYAGLNLGGTSGHADASTTTVFSSSGYFAPNSVPAIATAGAQSLGANSFAGGGQAGFNFQHKSFVFGVETDIGSMSASQSKSTTAKYPCCPATFTITQFAGTSWLYTLRPRIGFTRGPVLVYGTGGLAVTDVDYTALFTDTFASALEHGGKTGTQTGWAAGAGVEFKPGRRWSLKGEYLRSEFNISNTSTNLTTTLGPFPSSVFTHRDDLTGNVYRFGFNYHF